MITKYNYDFVTDHVISLLEFRRGVPLIASSMPPSNRENATIAAFSVAEAGLLSPIGQWETRKIAKLFCLAAVRSDACCNGSSPSASARTVNA